MSAADLPSSAAEPALGRRERKKAETRQRILRAAAQLFSDRGFEATTVEEIAERADVSRGTFFNYYSEKSALMEALGDGMTEFLLERIEEARNASAPTAQRLASLFSISAVRLEERPDLSREILLQTLARRTSLDERRSHTARLHDGIAKLLADGVERGEVRSDVPVSLLAELVAGGYVEVLVMWLMDADYRLGERLRQAAAVLGSALSPAATQSRRPSSPAQPAGARARQRTPKR